MSEHIGPIDQSILGLLREHRRGIVSARDGEARQYLATLQREERAVSIETLVATEILELQDRMLQKHRQLYSVMKKRMSVRAGRLLMADTTNSLNQRTANRIIEKVSGHPPRSLRTAEIEASEADGLPEEQVRQGWYFDLDIRAMPASDTTTRSAHMTLYCSAVIVGQELEANAEVYDLKASEQRDGTYTAAVTTAEGVLQGEELFPPLGFVLAAQKQYV